MYQDFVDAPKRYQQAGTAALVMWLISRDGEMVLPPVEMDDELKGAVDGLVERGLAVHAMPYAGKLHQVRPTDAGLARFKAQRTATRGRKFVL